MTPIIRSDNLRDSTLWKQLNEGFSGKEDEADAVQLAQFLLQICREAQERMRSFYSLHPQYTLHDETHFLRVTELMAMVMPDEMPSNELNIVEIALLILSAYLHDQGMVLESEEIEALHSNPQFRIFERDWEIDHPNFREVRQRLRDKHL